MVDGPHARGIEILAGCLVLREGVGRPSCPTGLGDDLIEFLRAGVAVLAAHMLGAAEVQRVARIGRGDQVPAGAALADVVHRGELRATI